LKVGAVVPRNSLRGKKDPVSIPPGAEKYGTRRQRVKGDSRVSDQPRRREIKWKRRSTQYQGEGETWEEGESICKQIKSGGGLPKHREAQKEDCEQL